MQASCKGTMRVQSLEDALKTTSSQASTEPANNPERCTQAVPISKGKQQLWRRWDHWERRGKGKRGLSAEPCQGGGDGAGDAPCMLGCCRCLHRMGFQGCQVDFLSAPCTDTCGLLHDTSLYFLKLMVSIITPRQSLQSRDK